MAEQFISAKGVSFRLLGFPVLYRWSALALPLLFIFLGGPSIGPDDLLVVVEAVLALGLAIGLAVLIHELGHAATARHFGGTARIELVFFGGLTRHHYPAPLGNGPRALVSLAGAGAGLAAAIPVFLLFPDAVWNPSTIWEMAISFFARAGGAWGILNLVPLPGLDGSHVLDAGVRAVAPHRAPVIVPVVTGLLAVVAIVLMYSWGGTIAAVWLLIIFGPELAATPTRIREARDEPLVEEAIEAERAFRRGDLETAATLAEAVLARSVSPGIVRPMADIRKAALARMGRIDELLRLDHDDPNSALPPLMRARALASVGRTAEAEAEARTVLEQPEAAALVAELLVIQDVDHRAPEVLTRASAPILNARAVELELTDPKMARRLASVIAESRDASPLDVELARMTLGQQPVVDDLAADDRWIVETEWAVRAGDATGFEQAMRSIPGPGAARQTQRRLHVVGRHDHAARIGSVVTPDPDSRFLLARSFARLGHTTEAMMALETAVASGWSDAAETVTNPDLIGLHGQPGWRRLLDRMAAGGDGGPTS